MPTPQPEKSECSCFCHKYRNSYHADTVTFEKIKCPQCCEPPKEIKEDVLEEEIQHDLPGEIWKDIPEYVGKYQASSLGRIRSLRKNGYTCYYLKLWLGTTGRKVVGLSKDNNVIQFQVHRLVLSAFIGQCPEGMEACHNDGNPRNNKIENLRWDTHKNNMEDKKVHGTWGSWDRHSRASLKNYETEFIKSALEDGIDEKYLIELFDVSHHIISSIKCNKKWNKMKPCCLQQDAKSRKEQREIDIRAVEKVMDEMEDLFKEDELWSTDDVFCAIQDEINNLSKNDN